MINVPGRMHSATTEGVLAGADEIMDDALGKTQAEINQDILERLAALEGT